MTPDDFIIMRCTVANVQFEINDNAIRNKLNRMSDRAMRAVAEQLNADAYQQYVKVNTGDMRQTMGVEQTEEGKWQCFTDILYARYQYYFHGVGRGSKQNPKATPMWYHKCVDANRANYRKTAQRACEGK